MFYCLTCFLLWFWSIWTRLLFLKDPGGSSNDTGPNPLSRTGGIGTIFGPVDPKAVPTRPGGFWFGSGAWKVIATRKTLEMALVRFWTWTEPRTGRVSCALWVSEVMRSRWRQLQDGWRVWGEALCSADRADLTQSGPTEPWIWNDVTSAELFQTPCWFIWAEKSDDRFEVTVNLTD